jgi:hypothetical protein
MKKMKKILFLASIIASSLCAKAQWIDGKVLTVFTAKYDILTNKTVLVDSVNWDDPAFELPIGFSFHYFGNDVTDLYANDQLSMDGILFTQDLNIASAANMMGFAVDLFNTRFDGHLSNPNSSIAYQTDTVNNKLVTKIQYDHVGFYDDTAGLDYINIQTWLYEKDSAIEYHIGKSSIDPNMFSNYFVGSGPAFIYGDNLDFNNQTWDKMYSLVSLSPALADTNTLADVMNNGFSGLSDFPDSGTVIRLAPAKINVAINHIVLNENISINTIVDNNLIVNLIENKNEYQFRLIDARGKTLIHQRLTSARNEIDCSNLCPGNYIVNMAKNNESLFYKIVKR